MSILNIAMSTMLTNPAFSIFSLIIFFLLTRSLYRIYFHPLSHIPGPLLPKITSLWLYYYTYHGTEPSTTHTLHAKYGPLVRVSPHVIDISTPSAITPIYSTRGGFPKAPCYANFDIEGHKTIFSTTSNVEYRNVRVKAAQGLFSIKGIKQNENVLYKCIDEIVLRMQTAKKKQGKIDVLNLCRCLAVDIVSTHLFEQNYHGIDESSGEEEEKLSAGAFVDTFVAVGRFFYLPTWAFQWLDWTRENFWTDEKTRMSFQVVEDFVEGLVGRCKEGGTSFVARLLEIGVSREEVKAQCKDLIFAGTDSTGTNMATACRMLALFPEKYERLYNELLENEHAALKRDIQSLPYLSATIRETLRISMANPTRLPHVVPSTGFTMNNIFIPPSTIVGCSAYSLHFNPHIFPNPFLFHPERWLPQNVTPEMNKSFFAFGAGGRACIARNLAMAELFMGVERIVLADVLRGGYVEEQVVRIWEWFNSGVQGGKIEIFWEGGARDL